MDYLVHPDVSEEIDNREADPLTGNIIGAAIWQVIIEIKSVNAIAPIYEAQLLSYLRLYGTCSRGLLINFNVKRLVEGIRRMKI
jgi:GxxExxY protein